MYTPIQIEAIKIFGRKDLESGLLFLSEKNKRILRYIGKDSGQYALSCEDSKGHILLFVESLNGAEILGHVPHLEDLFRVAEEKGIDFGMEFGYTLRVSPKDGTYHEIKYNPTLPLIDQPSLPEIINLFK